MNFKTLAALPLILALAAAPVSAGTLGATASEPDLIVPPPPPGGLGVGPLAAGVGALILVCALACGGDSSSTTTTTAPVTRQ